MAIASASTVFVHAVHPGPVVCDTCPRRLGSIIVPPRAPIPTYMTRYQGRRFAIPLFVLAGGLYVPTAITVECEGEIGVGCDGRWRWPEPVEISQKTEEPK